MFWNELLYDIWIETGFFCLQAPRTNWVLSYEAEEMVKSHRALWTWLQKQLDELGVGTFDVEHNGVKKSFYLLP